MSERLWRSPRRCSGVALTILHPGGTGNEPAPYEGIADDANRWIFVHFAQLVLTPLLAVGVWMLLDGIQSVAATIARATLVVWMVFFSAFDAIAGIAVGVLTRYAAPQVLFGISCLVPTGARD